MRRRGAFSLVELSVVLVIIGLLITAISTGTKLVEQSKVNTVISQLREYEYAYNNFYMTYNAFPGDISNATSYFSGTQDGNGNDIIESACSGGPNGLEPYMAMQHLNLAGLIQHNYTGVGVVDGAEAERAEIGTNIAATSFGGIGMLIRYMATITVYSGASDSVVESNLIQLGGPHQTCTGAHDTTLKTVYSYNIDKKIDDALPSKGKVYSGSVFSSCVEAGATDDQYNLDDDSQLCRSFYTLSNN